MNTSTISLARSTTFASSKQTYYTARLLVDHDLEEDCLRAYAYLRWVDDVIDAPALSDHPSESRAERIAFIQRQRQIVERLYGGEAPNNLTLEEQMVADLIQRNPEVDSGLHSFIGNFLQVLEFDAIRKGRLIDQSELIWYSKCLGKSVTDGIQYFIGNAYAYPDAPNRYLAATAAHITHMLRDMVEDLDEGFINIPRERLQGWGLDQEVVSKILEHPNIKDWVREQVELARENFRAGKKYLDQLQVLRCKIAGYWYCARFEGILDTIEADGYALRAHYNQRRKLKTWLEFAWSALSLTMEHIAGRLRYVWKVHRNIEPEGKRCRMIEMHW